MHWFNLDYCPLAKFNIRCYHAYKLVWINTQASQLALEIRNTNTTKIWVTYGNSSGSVQLSVNTSHFVTSKQPRSSSMLSRVHNWQDFVWVSSVFLSVCTLATNEQRCDLIVLKVVYTQVCRRCRCFHSTDWSLGSDGLDRWCTAGGWEGGG